MCGTFRQQWITFYLKAFLGVGLLSIVISVFPDKTYWVVLNCTWNLFTIENLGVYESGLMANVPYKSPVNIDCIFRHLDRWLRQALTEPQFSSNYARVDMVKVIV